jgi:hypothetical protein
MDCQYLILTKSGDIIMVDELENEIRLRRRQKLQLIQNPNYFGNLSELNLKDIPGPVIKKIGDTTFEELTCLGHNPASQILTAIVQVKKPSGYLGDSCTDGSREYVRFYLDYGDGSWVDHGVASFEAHDLKFKDDLCYAVSIRLEPKRRSCCDDKPVLPRVRAILSWNIQPPSNTPNYLPVWGNRLERSIQIRPRSRFLCEFFDKMDVTGVQKIDPMMLEKIKQQLTIIEPESEQPASITKLMKSNDSDDELSALRNIYPMVAKLAADDTDIDAFQSLQNFAPLNIDISKFNDFIIKPDFNTTYEELHCVGLDRDREYLHGVVEIKRRSGYSGDLCDPGSREYIAFYLDFGSGWEYQGTTFVNVHNIDQIPKDGLWYQASLPVKLDKHKKEWCDAGKARIRGILSWAVPPAPNQPEYVPHWGDREDCNIEIKPLPEGIPPLVFKPILESIGNIAVQKIIGGYANGTAIGGIYVADDSPFGGRVLLSGNTFNTPAGPLEYRIMIQGPSDVSPRAYTNPFDVDVTTFPSSTPVSQTQNAVGEWFNYLPANPLVSVADSLLGVLTGLENGLHTVYLEFRQPAGPVLDTTDSIDFMVDNTRPVADVEITSGTGNCGKFTIGELVKGTFSMSEIHSHSLTLSVTPGPESHGGTLSITTATPIGPSTLFPISETTTGGSATKTSVSMTYAAGTLNTNGVASGEWQLDTTGMDPCGYNIRIHAEDRTIVNSANIGWGVVDIEGFCVEKG